jgi:surface antigen
MMILVVQQMKRCVKIVVSGLVAVAFLGASLTADLASWTGETPTAWAGEHKAKHKNKHKHKHAHRYQGLYKRGGGPPPWAPAHGYRRKKGHSHDAAYLPPFDLDLGRCNRELLGVVLGGAAGGVVGSKVGKGDGKTAAIIGGTILGAIVGGAIGKAMDQVDANCVGQILEHTPDGGTVIWENPDNGGTYHVTPTGSHQNSQGQYCREYQTTATIGGRPQEIYGTACRQADGSWKLVS